MILPKSPRKGALLRCNMINDRVNLGVTIQLIFKFGFIGEFGLQLSGGKGGRSPPLPKRVAGSAEGGLERLGARRKPQENWL